MVHLIGWERTDGVIMTGKNVTGSSDSDNVPADNKRIAPAMEGKPQPRFRDSRRLRFLLERFGVASRPLPFLRGRKEFDADVLLQMAAPLHADVYRELDSIVAKTRIRPWTRKSRRRAAEARYRQVVGEKQFDSDGKPWYDENGYVVYSGTAYKAFHELIKARAQDDAKEQSHWDKKGTILTESHKDWMRARDKRNKVEAVTFDRAFPKPGVKR